MWTVKSQGITCDKHCCMGGSSMDDDDNDNDDDGNDGDDDSVNPIKNNSRTRSLNFPHTKLIYNVLSSIYMFNNSLTLRIIRSLIFSLIF